MHIINYNAAFYVSHIYELRIETESSVKAWFRCSHLTFFFSGFWFKCFALIILGDIEWNWIGCWCAIFLSVPSSLQLAHDTYSWKCLCSQITENLFLTFSPWQGCGRGYFWPRECDDRGIKWFYASVTCSKADGWEIWVQQKNWASCRWWTWRKSLLRSTGKTVTGFRELLKYFDMPLAWSHGVNLDHFLCMMTILIDICFLRI